MSNPLISLRLPPNVLTDLDYIAQRRGIERADLARNLLLAGLESAFRLIADGHIPRSASGGVAASRHENARAFGTSRNTITGGVRVSEPDTPAEPDTDTINKETSQS
jgi:hypothetical protein